MWLWVSPHRAFYLLVGYQAVAALLGLSKQNWGVIVPIRYVPHQQSTVSKTTFPRMFWAKAFQDILSPTAAVSRAISQELTSASGWLQFHAIYSFWKDCAIVLWLYWAPTCCVWVHACKIEWRWRHRGNGSGCFTASVHLTENGRLWESRRGKKFHVETPLVIAKEVYDKTLHFRFSWEMAHFRSSLLS